ncbi:MAG: hypothetical protein GX257_04915 [Clostridiales bacterium]|nr:hypothetical protein [Clostridiales bacterium]
MITQIISNKIKSGTKEEYILISKKFCEALVADEGAIEARVYEDINSDTNVVNIVRWNTEAEAEKHLDSPTFQKFIPQLLPFFEGNTTTVLIER